MKSNKKNTILGSIVFLILIGIILLSLLKNKNIPTTLTSVYKNSKIEVREDPYHYTIDTNEFYAKEIEVGGIKLFLTVENNNDEWSVYRFYTYGNNPKLLKEVAQLIPPENSDQILNKNMFFKDITGDGKAEIFIIVQMAGSGGTSYEILRLDNNGLVNIKLEGEKSNWVGFDDIDYKDGYVYMTWHGTYSRGQSIYELDKNILKFIKSFELDSFNENDGFCSVIEKSSGNEKSRIIIKHKKNCNVWTDSFDPYF